MRGSPFSWSAAPAQQQAGAADQEKTGGGYFGAVTQGGARSSLALGYLDVIPTGFR
jgi:hypothetical protein